MMFSDEEIKEIPGNNFMRPGDEILCIREVCLDSKYDRRELDQINENLLSNFGKNDLDVPRSLFRDGFFPDGGEQWTKLAWTEEDGNIASLVSEPGFGTTGHTTFGKDLDAALKSEMKEADSSAVFAPSSSTNSLVFNKKPHVDAVSSTSGNSYGLGKSETRGKQACKVDKEDPRSRFHYVKYVKRNGRTIKLWECGICSREFQHQYTLMRHLPTHTDERNFHCSACGKSFRQLSTLSQHRAIHSSDRPYACEVCNKTFNRVSTLISHRKTHSDEKPYKCHLCPKGFHQKGNLRNHLFTHTNERPYRCDICFKGFNQQSNLVCHKNKAHTEDGNKETISGNLIMPRNIISYPENRPDSSRTPQHCEVSSSVGPYLPAVDGPSTTTWHKPYNWPKVYPEAKHFWNNDMHSSGVIVDAIKTYHMEVALATKQTPFALLKSDNSSSVLVKVIDTRLPGGKQMLVPATAEDLRVGGKIVVNNNDNQVDNPAPNLDGSVQIRVPVVATVVPKINSGGRLQLEVVEPHQDYTAMSNIGNMAVERCTPQKPTTSSCTAPMPQLQKRPDTLQPLEGSSFDPSLKSVPPPRSLSPRCASPPLDLISMDLFEPMVLPMGPQITAVDNIEDVSPSDDSDIFITEFECKYVPM